MGGLGGFRVLGGGKRDILGVGRFVGSVLFVGGGKVFFLCLNIGVRFC